MLTNFGRLFLLFVLTAVTAAVFASDGGAPSVRLAVVAHADETHFTRAATEQLQKVAAQAGIDIAVEPAPLAGVSEAGWDLMLMPVRSLASRVPALEILELPFFYPSLDAVRANLDGALGQRLDAEATARGWKIVAFWDEGMHIISGIKRFDRVRNLKAREFLITRPDPVAERQFAYWSADARRIDPENREAVLRECLIANRAATLQEVVREQLFRVHLAMSLTNHRYEGWVVVAPHKRWQQFDQVRRHELSDVFRHTTAWQRRDAEAREADARNVLTRARMTLYEVDSTQRDAFRTALPDWADLLSDTLSETQKRELIGIASTGTAAFLTAATATQTPPDSQAHQPDQGGG